MEYLEPRQLLAAETLGLGHGLAADYFSDPEMANLAAARIDPQVDFTWGAAAPDASLPADGFSVRWIGKIQAQYSQTYTFYTQTAADDGVRLTIYTADLAAVGGRKINTLIDTWTSHTAAEQSGTLPLTAGETYDVALEYANHSGDASLALRWSSPLTAKAVLPESQLYPTQALAVSTIGGNWLTTDVGSPATAGSLTSQGNAYTLRGGGTGFGATSDQFHYAYQVLQGDGSAVVRVDALSGSAAAPQAQLGLMVRDGTAADAVYAGLFLTPSAGIVFGSRTTVGGTSATVTQPGDAAPQWLKLVRRGPTINGYVSATGAEDSWTFAGRADIAGLADAVLIGTAAAAGSASAAITARLSNVTMAADIPLAANLGQPATYSGTLPFIDLVKVGCGPALRLDANGTFNSAPPPANLDPNDGWPTEDFGYKGIYAQKPDGFAGRSCTLTFTGKATVTIVSPGLGTATPASAATGDPDYTAGYNAATNSSKWHLVTTDASGGNSTGISPYFRNTQRTAESATNTGVTNIQLLQPGYTSYDLHHVFTQEWLDLIKQAKEFRIHNWVNTDYSTISEWSQRNLPSAHNQTPDYAVNNTPKGIAWEFLVQVCNLTHRDMWITLPAHASNDYLRNLARLIRYGSDGRDPYTSPQANPVFPGLAPDLNVYFEYSNEVWNYGFESNAYAQAQAWAAYQAGTRFGPNQVPLNYDGRTWTGSNNLDLIYRWVAAHLGQDIVPQWIQVFGAEAINTRIRPVLSGWMAYADRTNEEGLRFLAAAGWTPQDNLYAISVAGYYGYNDLAYAQVTTNAARASATEEETIQTFQVAATVERGALVWPYASALAAGYGVKLAAYEASPSLGTTYAQAAAQLDPRFREINTAVVNSWFAAGGEQYNYFTVDFPVAYGSSVGDFAISDNRWNLNEPRAQSFSDLCAAPGTPPIVDGFTALPSGELDARYYVNNADPDPLYTVAPSDWEATRTYRYMVRSLVAQDVDLRLSLAAAASGDRVRLSVNGEAIQTYDFAIAAARDPANNFLYTDTSPRTIHLNPGLNMIDLVLSNVNDTTGGQYAKARINSLKFTPAGGSLANTLPWIFGLPGNPLALNATQMIAENATSNFYVDIQDQETPALAGQPSPFTITAVSDNPALLPNDAAHISLNYNASMTRWLLGLTPASNQTGKVNLTVTVTDPGGAVRTWTVPVNVVPAAPTSVTAAPAGDGTVTVSWTNNSRVNPSFKIERSVELTNANAWVQVGLTGATAYGATTWTDKPPGGASYYYRISGVDSGGISNNIVYANSNAAVAVPADAIGGSGLNATNLFSGKTSFVSSTDTVNGGRSKGVVFDGTSQYFAFSATSGNVLAVTGLAGTTGIDTLKFSYPAGTPGQRIPAVSLYYSTSDYSASGQAAALNAANYTRLGTSSYPLYQANVTPVTTQPDGVLVSTLSGLAIPAGVRSVLLVFDSSAAAPFLAELQAFAVIGAAAPTGVGYTTAWTQFGPGTFANYVGASVTLTWTDPSGPTVPASFVVQRDTASTFGTVNLRTFPVSLNATSLTNDRDYQDRALAPYAAIWESSRNTPLPAGTTYYYRVGTRQADGTVLYAAAIPVTTAAAAYPLAAPTGLTATAASNYRIDLNWTAVPGATGYKIEKSVRGDFRDTNYAMAWVSGTNYADSTVVPNSTWYYRVRAVGTGGDSAWATASATAAAITAAPTGLAAQADATTIRLAWDRPDGKLYGYEVYRGTSPADLAPYKTFAVGSSAVIVPRFLDAGLPGATTYYYAVRGVLWSNNTVPSQLQYTALSNVAQATTPAITQVVGRHVFYNNSAFDGNSAQANDQDYDAIAPGGTITGHGHAGELNEPDKALGKAALLPGQTTSFVAYTSYARGLNGILIAFDSLANPAALSLTDFVFRVGNDGDPAGWPAAPAPRAAIRVQHDVVHAAFPGQPDVVTITWADEDPYTALREPGAISNQWLQVTVLATAATGLAADDVFYFGNQIGESGNSADANVDQNDEIGARNHPHTAFNAAAISDPYDFNRDGKVDQNDEILARNNPATAFTRLQRISAPSADASLQAALAAASGETGPLPGSSDWDAAMDELAESHLRKRPMHRCLRREWASAALAGIGALAGNSD